MKVTRFEALMRVGAGMVEKERVECIRGLMLDERFAGLLGWIAGERDSYVKSGCGQEFAGAPGKQSHTLGSYFGLQTLLDGLSGIEPRNKKVESAEC